MEEIITSLMQELGKTLLEGDLIDHFIFELAFPEYRLFASLIDPDYINV